MFESQSYLKLNAVSSFDVLAAVMFQVEVFCVVTSRSVVVRYQRFRGPGCLHLLLRWRQHVSPKFWYPITSSQDVTTQITSTYKFEIIDMLIINSLWVYVPSEHRITRLTDWLTDWLTVSSNILQKLIFFKLV